MAAFVVAEGMKSTTEPRIIVRVVEGVREKEAMRVHADDILVSKMKQKERGNKRRIMAALEHSHEQQEAVGSKSKKCAMAPGAQKRPKRES